LGEGRAAPEIRGPAAEEVRVLADEVLALLGE
jgi:hypothetical protein